MSVSHDASEIFILGLYYYVIEILITGLWPLMGFWPLMGLTDYTTTDDLTTGTLRYSYLYNIYFKYSVDMTCTP